MKTKLTLNQVNLKTAKGMCNFHGGIGEVIIGAHPTEVLVTHQRWDYMGPSCAKVITGQEDEVVRRSVGICTECVQDLVGLLK